MRRGERRENEWISVNIFDSYSTYFMPGEVLIFWFSRMWKSVSFFILPCFISSYSNSLSYLFSVLCYFPFTLFCYLLFHLMN